MVCHHKYTVRFYLYDSSLLELSTYLVARRHESLPRQLIPNQYYAQIFASFIYDLWLTI